MVVGLIALFVALGGTGYAATQLGGGPLDPATIAKKKKKKRARCRPRSCKGPKGGRGTQGLKGPKGDRGPRGRKGDKGVQGKQGLPGAAATKLWAAVSVSGATPTLATGSGVTGVSHLGLGLTTVSFTQDITGCSYQATLWNNAGGAYAVPPPAIVTAITGGGTQANTDIRVATQRGDNGAPTDGYSFNLAVFC